jgi:type IV secretory pathway TrbL component
MQIFKTVSMSTWDIGVIKIAVACMAISIGATWPEVFAPYVKAFVVVGILAGAYALSVWIKK